MWNSIWRSGLFGLSIRSRKVRRVTCSPAVGIEHLETRQLLSAVSVSHAEPRAEQTHVFWDDFSPISTPEGNTGSKVITLHIFSSPEAKKDIKISGQIKIAGTGTGFADGDDFKIEPFTATIKKGQASTDVQVTIFGDTTPEPDEVFQAVITKATGAVIDSATASVTILDDDAVVDPVLPKVSIQPIANAAATEGQAQTYTLQLDKVSATDINVTVTLSGLLVGAGVGIVSAATIPDDAQFAGGASQLVVTIPAGTLTKTFDVLLVDDSIPEATEVYTVAITSATGATPSGNISQVGSILDNDGPPKVSIAAQTNVEEGNSGTTTASVNISLDKTSDQPVTVNYSIEIHKVKGMKATDRASKKDFVIMTGSVTIAAGETTGNIPVQIVGDTKAEHNETFQVRLVSVNGTGATLASTDSVGLVTIIDDDSKTMQ
jgi:hypothetical protein